MLKIYILFRSWARSIETCQLEWPSINVHNDGSKRTNGIVVTQKLNISIKIFLAIFEWTDWWLWTISQSHNERSTLHYGISTGNILYGTSKYQDRCNRFMIEYESNYAKWHFEFLLWQTLTLGRNSFIKLSAVAISSSNLYYRKWWKFQWYGTINWWWLLKHDAMILMLKRIINQRKLLQKNTI